MEMERKDNFQNNIFINFFVTLRKKYYKMKYQIAQTDTKHSLFIFTK